MENKKFCASPCPEKKLAIVIPAYKSHYLRETLESIARQTCRDFVLYIGDDASPEPLEEVVRTFADRLPIVYHRFPENMGRHDLPGHWDRCIALSAEPVVWLFSDDDLMPADGVARVLDAVARYGQFRFFARFPLTVVDACGQPKRSNPPLPTDAVSGYDFLRSKLMGEIDSAACEYVFSRDLWQQANGFIKFPLAWCSDDATWTRFAELADGLRPLPGAPVCWRNAEGMNISDSACYDAEKLRATALFLRWIARYFPGHRKDPELGRALEKYVHTILHHSVQGRFTRTDLWHLCAALARINRMVAWRIAWHFVI